MYKRSLFLQLILIIGLNRSGICQQKNHLQYVNPFIGTTKSNVLTHWGSYGGTYPGAVAPSGVVQLSPETRVIGAKGYDYADSSIYYFSCFKHFSGFPEGSAGKFYMMPVNADQPFEAGKSSRKFLHVKEVSRPGYYKVIFEDDHSTAEATATTRTGLFRFTFPSESIPRIFLGDAGEISTPNGQTVHAANGNTVLNFSQVYQDKKQVKGGWIFTFRPSSTRKQVITLKISTSTVAFASAQHNIDLEIGKLGFDKVCKKTSSAWAEKLAVVVITDNNTQNKNVFYTALYHSLLIPWVVEDADGRYKGLDGKIHHKSGKNQYGGFSPWDTFRSLHPLLSLLYPQKQNDVVLSMLDIYRQTGHLPVETMTGNHAIPIIVDSYLKGITGFDKTLAYKAIKKSLIEPPFIQPDMQVYQQNGYIPFTRPESVTRTMEYAYDDWAMAQFAKSAAHDKSDYQQLLKRSYNYRNLFNAGELFFLPRNKDEFKLKPGTSGYKEGDKWVYSYFVLHNGKDLINLLGGNAQFASRLDSALTNNVILFDNETVFHLPYLFSQAGRPDLTQKWCRQIMQERFSAGPGGLPGNDDLGSTSSWYVFSTMGFYPVCPGKPLYSIGLPLFQSVIINLPNGKKLQINTKNTTIKEASIQSLKVNGKDWQQLTISHKELLKGGTLNFNLGNGMSNWPTDKNPIEFSETKQNPNFKVVSFFIGKRSIEPDEAFWVYYTIKNSGSIGTKTVKLLLNGKPYGYKNSLVASGQAIKDSIICRLYRIGEAKLNVIGTTPVIVTVNQPKVQIGHPFKITALTMIPMIRINETQLLNFTIKNISGTKNTFRIPLLINDTTVYKDIIALEPGAEKTIQHSFTDRMEGFRYVRVDDQKCVYKVYRNNTESLLLDLSQHGNIAGNILKDRSGFGNNGNLITPSINRMQTKDNQLIFGEHCFVEVPNSSNLDEMGETLTIMAWLYPGGNEQGLVDIFTKGDNHVLQVTDGKTLTFFAGGWGRGDCTVNLPEDWKQNWHHIAGVCKGNSLFLYIDGALKGTTVMEEVVNLSNTNKWTLGRNEEFPSGRIYNGYLDKAKVFKAALSAEEIFHIFKMEKKYLDVE